MDARSRALPQIPALFVSIAIGLPLMIALGFSLSEQGASQVEAPEGKIEWPNRLMRLPAQVGDLTVDETGNVWFAILDDSGEGRNVLYEYEPTSQKLDAYGLMDDLGSGSVARVDVGRGQRRNSILVGWESTLLEFNRESGDVSRLHLPLDPGKIMSDAGPSSTRIYDLAVDEAGTVWVSRDHYPYLIAVYSDGSSKEFALPGEAGSPERLAVDGQGRIWATLIRHRPFSNGPDLPATNAYRLTLRFDPATGEADVLPIEAWNIAGQGGKVVAMAGDAPATVQRLDAGAGPVDLTAFGPTLPGDELAVGRQGDVWYRSGSLPGLVRLAPNGSAAAFPLPTVTGDLRDTGCVPRAGYPDACTGPMAVDTPVLAIAAAPDGSAWFSTGDRIGHAIP